MPVFGSERHEVHKPRRQAMNNFFSKASVTRLEPLIHHHIHKMCDKISHYGKEGKPILIRNAAVAVTVDIVTEYCIRSLSPFFMCVIRSTNSWEKKKHSENQPTLSTFLTLLRIGKK